VFSHFLVLISLTQSNASWASHSIQVFLKFLSYSNPTLSDPDDETEPGPIEKLQAAIVENVNLYAEKYEEEFAPHLPGFAQAVWALLMRCGPHNKFDALASTAIRFLTSIVSKQHYSSLFAGHLSDIVTQIVVPNLMLRESDEELFEDNPAEWIQKVRCAYRDLSLRLLCKQLWGVT